MEDRRVQSTLEKLQGTYEEKVLKIERIKHAMEEKEAIIDELSKEQPILAMQYAERSLELASLQKQHGNMPVYIACLLPANLNNSYYACCCSQYSEHTRTEGEPPREETQGSVS
ncbi:hypothetical protein EON65_17010 [archaeon]|nr:MAG: hypothetical protein EON65_17010 [archaeon]